MSYVLRFKGAGLQNSISAVGSQKHRCDCLFVVSVVFVGWHVDAAAGCETVHDTIVKMGEYIQTLSQIH